MNKLQKQVKGKVVEKLENDSYYGTTRIWFTDGSHLRLVSYTTGSHNDRWSAIQATYFEEDTNGN